MCTFGDFLPDCLVEEPSSHSHVRVSPPCAVACGARRVCQSMRYPRARATSAPSTALPITLILSPVPGLAAAHAPHPHLRAPPITLILSPVPGLAAAYAPHPHLRAPPRGAFTALKCTSKTLILSPVPGLAAAHDDTLHPHRLEPSNTHTCVRARHTSHSLLIH